MIVFVNSTPARQIEGRGRSCRSRGGGWRAYVERGRVGLRGWAVKRHPCRAGGDDMRLLGPTGRLGLPARRLWLYPRGRNGTRRQGVFLVLEGVRTDTTRRRRGWVPSHRFFACICISVNPVGRQRSPLASSFKCPLPSIAFQSSPDFS